MENEQFAAMRKIILLSMILIPISTFVTILGIGYYTFTKTIEKRTIISMERIVKDHRHMIESFLLERKADLEFVADTYTFDALTSEESLRAILSCLERKSSAFLDLGVFDQSGIHIAYRGPYKLAGKIYSDEDWFKTVIKQGYYISDVYLGFRNAPHFVLAVTREINDQKWVIRATIDSYMFNDLVENVRIGKTGEAYIVNTKGVFQTKRRSGGNLMQHDPEIVAFPSFGESDIQSFFEKDVDGVKYLYTIASMKDKNWILVVRQEEADVFAAIRSAAYLVVLIILIGGGMIVGIAFVLTDRMVRRMEKLDREKVQLNQQLIGASRLAELGEMAAGFAHEINNPLQIIKSEHSLIKMILPDLMKNGKPSVSDSFKEINDSMDQIDLQISRCAVITRAILKFGRQSDPEPMDIDLNPIIREVAAMVEKKAEMAGVSIIQDLSGEPLIVHGEPPELQQVLLNLFNNALYAIEEQNVGPPGQITIKSRGVDGHSAQIEVSDNGIGISPENLKKIFSPFFTTKPVGKGTGLGLSICFGIIEKMRGIMEVDSQKGIGTTFAIRLPLSFPKQGRVHVVSHQNSGK